MTQSCKPLKFYSYKYTVKLIECSLLNFSGYFLTLCIVKLLILLVTRISTTHDCPSCHLSCHSRSLNFRWVTSTSNIPAPPGTKPLIFVIILDLREIHYIYGVCDAFLRFCCFVVFFCFVFLHNCVFYYSSN